MNVIPVFIKLNQKSRVDGGNLKGNSRTISPSHKSFTKIIGQFSHLHNGNAPIPKQDSAGGAGLNNEMNIKSNDSLDSVIGKLGSLLGFIPDRGTDPNPQPDEMEKSALELPSQLSPFDGMDWESFQLNEDGSTIVAAAGEIANQELIESIKLLDQALQLIEKMPPEETRNWLSPIEFASFQVYQQLLIKPIPSAPGTKLEALENQTSEIISAKNITGEPTDETPVPIQVELWNAWSNIDKKMVDLKQQAVNAPSTGSGENVTQSDPVKMDRDRDFPPRIVKLSQFVPEVIRWISGLLKTNPPQSNGIQATLSLHPEQVGEVDIRITASERKMSVQILTETSAAKTILENELIGLKESLRQLGITVEQVEVIQHTQTTATPVEARANQDGAILNRGLNQSPVHQLNSLASTMTVTRPEEQLAPQSIPIAEKVENLSFSLNGLADEKNGLPNENKGTNQITNPLEHQAKMSSSKILEKQQQPSQEIVSEPKSATTISDVASSEFLLGQTEQPQQERLKEPKSVQLLPKIALSDFVPEVSKWIVTLINNDSQESLNKETFISLKPEQLGTFSIKLAREHGSLSAQLSADIPSTREVLAGQLPKLKQTLQQQGISVQKLKIVQQPGHQPIEENRVNNLNSVNGVTVPKTNWDSGNSKVLSEATTEFQSSDIAMVEQPPLNETQQNPRMTAPSPAKLEPVFQTNSRLPEEPMKGISAGSNQEDRPETQHSKVQPDIAASEMTGNQPMQPPGKINGPKSPTVIPIARFVPEVSKWLGALTNYLPEQSVNTEVKISLQPSQLGNITIKATTDTRKLTTQIITETPAAKTAIASKLPYLRQTLQQQGVLVQKINVITKSVQPIHFSQTEYPKPGLFTPTRAREHPASFVKTREKQNVILSQRNKEIHVVKQKTVHEQIRKMDEGPTRTQTILPKTAEDIVAIATQELHIDDIPLANVREEWIQVTETVNRLDSTTDPSEEPVTVTLDLLGQKLEKQMMQNQGSGKTIPTKNVLDDAKIAQTDLFVAATLGHDLVDGRHQESRERNRLSPRIQGNRPTHDSSETLISQPMQQVNQMNVAKALMPMSPVVPVSQFVPQVRNWIEGFVAQNPNQTGSTEARFSLNPEHLGPIQIKIKTEQGKVTAQIVTDTILAKEALEVQLPALRQSLQQQGMIVQKLEIIQQMFQPADVSQTAQQFAQGGSGFSQEQRAYSSQQSSLKKQKNSHKEEAVKEIVFPSYGGRTPNHSTSSIDFTA